MEIGKKYSSHRGKIIFFFCCFKWEDSDWKKGKDADKE